MTKKKKKNFVNNEMEYLHDAWVLFAGLFSYFFKNLQAKLASLEKEKADGQQVNESVNRIGKNVHEVEKKVDKLGLTSIGRPEHKEDYNSLIAKINDIHLRVNDMEKRKADRITRVDVKMRQENGGTN